MLFESYLHVLLCIVAICFVSLYYEECIIIVTLANSLQNERYTAAITTVVTIAEILKNNGLATEKSKNLFLTLITAF